uniref:CSON015586 protein n=1 Tax=Culicoides sonorensis TaxID=179676 RepID=A0A336M1P0_CULSO
MILRVKKCVTKILIVAVLVLLLNKEIQLASSQRTGDGLCPPQDTILPCRCSSRGNEIQIWCSHSDLPRVLAGLKNVAKVVRRPIDELILENNYLPSLPGRAFSPLKVLRLMLRHNGLERLSSGWLVDLENSLVEVYIVERELRSVPIDSLFGMRQLEAITIQSENLKRAPDFSGLVKLRYINVQSTALMELSSQGFRDLINLETVHITSSRNLNRLEAGLFQDLPRLSHIDLSENGINWLHLRSMVGLPSLRTLELSGNRINNAGMVGRTIKDLSNLEIVKLDQNTITILTEGSFVDLHGLKEIYLNDNAITEIFHGAFHRTPKLKVVHLENNFIQRIHPESFLQPSGSGVETVHLENNAIDRIEELRSLLDTLPMLRFLDMSDNRISDIPYGALRGHGSLEQLYLDNNIIRIIERDAFMAMPGLRELRLRNNTLSDLLPMPFWNLPGLKGLDLSYNRFRRLDSHLLTGLPSLRRLDMSGNALANIDPGAFVKTPMLETLNISHNVLVHIHPATFRDLDRLFEIDAGYNQIPDMIPGLPGAVERVILNNNQLHTLPLPPSSLMDLPSLRLLDISGNKIERIPRSIFRTTPQLRILNLAENSLQNLDDEVFAGLDKLEKLNIQDNRIVGMHERSTEPLKNLREINMQGNRMELLIDHVFAESTKLEKADFSRNNIVEIAPDAFRRSKSLKALDVSSNNLREIPESLSYLEELKDLDVSFNQLTDLKPSIVAAWRNLEELRASNNKLPILEHGAFRNLPYLQYLDLSSNELEVIQPGAFRSLPELQEVVLADNKLLELPDRVFEDLPNLQAIHLQQNELRGIAPHAFHRSPSIVYLNLSANNFKTMENTGLKGARNLEVLDLSNNGIRKVTGTPLRGLDWLVELKLDNNRICGIKGEPFQSMPRLRVLSLRNNRMSIIPERTFRSIRSNIAILDVDGNPLECSCDMLWLRAWLQETENHYPGPRCRDGSMLREMRLSRSECSLPDANGRDNNKLQLTNDHGDTFSNRKHDYDECELENIESYHNNLPPSPEESDYFYDTVDYPNEINETFLATSNHSAPVNVINGNKPQGPGRPNSLSPNDGGGKDQMVDFNKNKFNNFGRPPVPPQNNSPFTFFGVPIPSIGNIFGNGRNGNQRAVQATGGTTNTRGKGRVQVYRPGETTDSRGNIKHGDRPTESYKDQTGSDTKDNRPTNENNLFYRPYFQTPFLQPTNVEKGGFAPMIPNSEKGFKPIADPNSTAKPEESKPQETVTQPNVHRGTDWPDDFQVVPLVTESQKNKITKNQLETTTPYIIERYENQGKHANKQNSVESDEQETEAPTTKSPKFNIPGWTEGPIVKTTIGPYYNHNNHKLDDDDEISKYEESDLPTTNKPPVRNEENVSENLNPIDNHDASVETHNNHPENLHPYIKKEYYDQNSENNNNPSLLSALVAPGAQQGIYRKSTITKIEPPVNERLNKVTSSVEEIHVTTTTQSTNNNAYDNDFGGSYSNEVVTRTSYDTNYDEPATQREGMDWYYSNYNGTGEINDLRPSYGYEPGLNSLMGSSANDNFKSSFVLLIIINIVLLQFRTTEKALELLRYLPRVQLGNLRPNPNSRQPSKRGRAQHGGDKHGEGSGTHQNYMRLGYATGNNPFYTKFTYEPYYKGHHLRRQYPPISLARLQLSIETNRIDAKKPIDITTICNTGLYEISPYEKQYGFQLTDEGADLFKAKVNIEVQHASELVIATIEKNGGVIRTAWYDVNSLFALVNPKKFFERGVPIMRRMLPPQDAVDYYTNPKNRGYLADPDEISKERQVLAQKYGYELPKIEDDPDYEMLTRTKDPRQVFFGLESGWVVSLKDKAIIKPVNDETKQQVVQ